jgi:hypothetical protein
MTLSAPAIGDKIKVEYGNGDVDTAVVSGPCDDSKSGRWYCVTHRQIFDNQMQKDSHIGRGSHKMVWLCFHHGPEVNPDWFKEPPPGGPASEKR